MIYSLDKINELADGDEDFIQSVVSAFLDEVPEDLEQLEVAIGQKNYSNIYQLAHKIKPNVDLLGMEQTRAAALDIENIGKVGDENPSLDQIFPILKKDIHQVISELKKDFGL
ncbi:MULTISPECIES: Hpt domain-containing protein [Cellulophaga]|jgi:HPt (histidine-containing phosphotransfer) domain-containing protein|uniref:HPt (Histidine-containing phosphotransfer) domain-containing protein n=2 Tax=Cellulophaga baltica TaxID=76594 RepID=A0A1G7JDH9_9FLAO|nr:MULTISPECIES: Hpt domain-containing protein [Cellulophaga]WFO17807.1 Hpt domain-containing protein [Cellulophaga baltica 4]AIY13428.1 histidine phosphotransferase [Cellulophaga baltica NN016038]AIZ41779.1 histidine phosphotransferase [Cellulophaga baltica 18]KGK31029.1 histidine phosphotransferase [Cellulophaga sp. E6(2014)]MBA6316178.1 Hpt domain-containing protein [Cellulophaga baltica]